ncbi:hypothetical protein ASPZODRAFT_759067 [Penicilliopsis zonata CBS 506.65]|uniref:Uncharacterized protein n=1 Tax=Penicilliopsis zonata CBS 506.65 TaxID=1073090 RepID=A0A1L9SAT4_9EURO|nr:hypothetical protein ASPZODRAFT_759067 [Penicilliopsis zonata CBS 506.65]OJJ44274.1 hypothetical protein ASPZODRAFT_759067 [Penicilliopsis zonata CBS 506.65]
MLVGSRCSGKERKRVEHWTVRQNCFPATSFITPPLQSWVRMGCRHGTLVPNPCVSARARWEVQISSSRYQLGRGRISSSRGARERDQREWTRLECWPLNVTASGHRVRRSWALDSSAWPREARAGENNAEKKIQKKLTKEGEGKERIQGPEKEKNRGRKEREKKNQSPQGEWENRKSRKIPRLSGSVQAGMEMNERGSGWRRKGKKKGKKKGLCNAEKPSLNTCKKERKKERKKEKERERERERESWGSICFFAWPAAAVIARPHRASCMRCLDLNFSLAGGLSGHRDREQNNEQTEEHTLLFQRNLVILHNVGLSLRST